MFWKHVIISGKFCHYSKLFLLFLSFSSSDTPIIHTSKLLVIVLQFLDILFHLFFSPLLFSLGGFYWRRHDYFPHLCPIYWWIHQRHSSFLLQTIFLVCPFDFLRASTSQLVLPICSCMLSIFSVQALSILILVVLISWFDNSNTCSVSLCFFTF